MHRIEVRLTHEGEGANSVFEFYTETLKDGAYVEMAPMESISAGGTSVVKFLEADERIIIVAKGNKARMVFDKAQSANVRVETDEEKKERAEREVRQAQYSADQAVIAAQANLEVAQTPSAEATRRAAEDLRKAEREAAELRNPKPPKEPATPQSGLGSPPTQGSPAAPSRQNPSNPASANTGPIASNQVKNGR